MKKQISITLDEKEENNVLEIKLKAESPDDMELLTAILNAGTLEAKLIDLFGNEISFNPEKDRCRIGRLILKGKFPKNREYRYNHLAPDVE